MIFNLIFDHGIILMDISIFQSMIFNSLFHSWKRICNANNELYVVPFTFYCNIVFFFGWILFYSIFPLLCFHLRSPAILNLCLIFFCSYVLVWKVKPSWISGWISADFIFLIRFDLVNCSTQLRYWPFPSLHYVP